MGPARAGDAPFPPNHPRPYGWDVSGPATNTPCHPGTRAGRAERGRHHDTVWAAAVVSRHVTNYRVVASEDM